MRHVTSSRYFFGLLVVTLILNAKIRAAEPAASPPESGIAAAKRDYDAVRAAGAGAEQQKLALPQQSIPTLSLPSDEISVLRAQGESILKKSKSKSDPAAKSKNWLVDAMSEPKDRNGKSEKNANGPSDLAADEERVDGESNARLDAGPQAPKRAPTSREDEGGSPRKLHENVPENPLLNYMAAWMTPQDFELLKVKTDGNSPAASGSPVVRFDTLPGAAISASNPGIGIGGEASRFSGGVESLPATKPNPYLAEFSPTEIPVSLTSAPPVGWESFSEPANAPARAPSFTEPVPTAKTDGTLDDLFKARDDAKYFKQLKRF